MSVPTLAHLAGISLSRNGFDVEDYITRNNLPERLIPQQYRLRLNSQSKSYIGSVFHNVTYRRDGKFTVESIRETWIDVKRTVKVETMWNTPEEVASFISCTFPEKPRERYTVQTWQLYIPDYENKHYFYCDRTPLDEQTILGMVNFIKNNYVEVN
jgi:hypothetical protein